jgi:small neutral amino acid transporter SnatA (MarC family)
VNTLISIINLFTLVFCVVMTFKALYEDYSESGRFILTRRTRIILVATLIQFAFNIAGWVGEFPVIDTLTTIGGAILIGAALQQFDQNKAAKETKREEHERVERLMEYTEINYSEGIEHDQNLHSSTNHARTRTTL